MMKDEGDGRFPLGGGHGNRRVLEPLETVPHPDTPHRRRKHERPEPTAHQPRTAPYVELHAHSAYSFLDGASAPEELARRAAELGFPALALTDHDGVWGAMEFAQACKSFGVRPIVGCELTVYGDAPLPARRDPDWRGNCLPECFHLTLLVESATGWRNLC